MSVSSNNFPLEIGTKLMRACVRSVLHEEGYFARVGVRQILKVRKID